MLAEQPAQKAAENGGDPEQNDEHGRLGNGEALIVGVEIVQVHEEDAPRDGARYRLKKHELIRPHLEQPRDIPQVDSLLVCSSTRQQIMKRRFLFPSPRL